LKSAQKKAERLSLHLSSHMLLYSTSMQLCRVPTQINATNPIFLNH